MSNIKTGKQVELKNAKIYTRYCSFKSDISKSGTFYVWDSNIKNNRVRITNTKDGVGAPGHITGWVDVDDLDGNSSNIKVGDKIKVSGNINVKPDGSGNLVYAKEKIMYVTEVLDKTLYSYFIAVANSKNNTKIGYITEQMVTKANE